MAYAMFGGKYGSGLYKVGLGTEPYYRKVGLGFQNSYGICVVHGSPLGYPYECEDFIFIEEPTIWHDRTGQTIDCSQIRDDLSSTCCEVVGGMMNWHNLYTGLTCYVSVQKKIANKWVTNPIGPTGDNMYIVIIISDPSEEGYDYWAWASIIFWVGNWEGNNRYEINGDGQYRFRISEADNKFTAKYLYFNIANIEYPFTIEDAIVKENNLTII